MTDWTAFSVSPSEDFEPSQSIFQIGQNLTLSDEEWYKQSSISVNTTASAGVQTTYSMSNFGFGQIVYTNSGTGNNNPSNSTIQSLLSGTSASVLVTPAFRGLGLPSAAWNSFSNLMEIVTKGQFDCFTEIENGVTVGWCFAYSSCRSFDNLWSFAFQAAFSG